MQPLRIERFLLKVLLWLPPLFLLWYLLASLLLLPVASATSWILTSQFPHAIAGTEQHGISVEILTHFAMSGANSAPSNAAGTLTFSLNALKYAYGWPLLLALTLATPTSTWRTKGWRALLGSVLLLIVPIWGIVCETLKVLVFQMPPAIAEQMGTTPLSRELLALAYQFGYLILPPVVPILLWAAFHRDFLNHLVPRRNIDDK